MHIIPKFYIGWIGSQTSPPVSPAQAESCWGIQTKGGQRQYN